MKHSILGCVMGVTALATAGAHELPGSDYPTAAKADYVFGCMRTNGETREVLKKYSCGIDYIAERLPYDAYVKVETIMRTNLDMGYRGSIYRELTWANEALDQFKKLQAKSNLECFE